MAEIKDVAAERAVLAGVIRYGADTYTDISDLITPTTFNLPANAVIWKAINHLYNQDSEVTLDFPSIQSACSSIGLKDFFDKIDEVHHFRSILNFPVEKSSVRKLAAKLKKLEVARKLKSEAEGIASRLEQVTGDESIDSILSIAENPIFEFGTTLGDPSNSGPVLMSAGAEGYLQHLLDNPREMMGIPTGFVRYDKGIGGGLRANSLDLIAARQKTGKTFLVDNIGLNITAQGIPVLNVDTEMTRQEHQVRVAACLSGLDSRNIERGKLTVEEKQRLKTALITLTARPYYYDCVIGMSFDEIMARMRRWVIRIVGLEADGKAKPCVVIYDYIKLMDTSELNKNLAEWQLLGFITNRLKDFMGRYGIAGLCFAQQNREGIKNEDTGTIRGADRILDTVTSFSIYRRKTPEEQAECGPTHRKYTHKMVTPLSRHGDGYEAPDYINFLAEYHKGKISEGPLNSETVKDNENEGFRVENPEDIRF